jgi:putative ABC transport system ATP-binding protein
MNGISVRNVSKEYPLGKTRVRALSEVTLEVHSGEIVCFMGPSGSGKSTLLHLIGLIDLPSTGSLELFGEEIDPKKDRKLNVLRRERLGFVFQSFNLIPVLTVRENVGYPLKSSRMGVGERRRRVQEMLGMVGLSDFGGRYPSSLSGGERQRVAVARALIRSPSLVLADEPTANLDSKNGSMVIDLLQSLSRGMGATVVLATHDTAVSAHADRIIRLHDGRIVA